MTTQLDQDTIDIINESHSDANDYDGFHAQSFADELAKRGMCIAPLTTPEPTLWLWRNGDHYLAYLHEYPCVEERGDPCTFGKPFGWAILKPSHPRDGAEHARSVGTRPEGIPNPPMVQS